jgi:outer membrane biosynthesis protein TonB
MRPSEKSFDQVKNILGKLERNIDELRSRRQSPDPAPAPVNQAIPSSPSRPGQPTAQTAAQTAAQRANSAFGRATPMRPTGS